MKPHRIDPVFDDEDYDDEPIIRHPLTERRTTITDDHRDAPEAWFTYIWRVVVIGMIWWFVVWLFWLILRPFLMVWGYLTAVILLATFMLWLNQKPADGPWQTLFEYAWTRNVPEMILMMPKVIWDTIDKYVI